MKITRSLSTYALLMGATLAFSSCDKKQDEVVAKNEISEETMSQIRSLGFSTQTVEKTDGGYLVEGDIMLTNEMLSSQNDYSMLRVGQDEQYRTNNLVSGLPRTITVRVSSTLPSAYVTATDEAIRRYNAENLRIRFSRVASTSSANITLTKAPSGAGYLASAGFPSGGNPYSQVLVNSASLGTSNATTTIASVLAHEIGHCIGFRHTDYQNRAYSCGGTATNEGASTVGAVLIPGTPSGADPNSWMLACIGGGQNRPFNANDRTALNYLY